MEWRKLKTIIILILLLVNGFLLVLVAARWGEAQRYERDALEGAAQVLEGNGIRVELDAVSPAGDLPPLAVERDLDRELAMAQALLGGGDVQAENRGGGLYLYRNGNGSLSVRAGGELSAEMADNPNQLADGGPALHAAALLKRMGVDAEQLGVEEDGEWTRVRFRQGWNGVPLFSCEVEFVYYCGTILYSVQGTLLTAQAGTAEAGGCLTLPTALMRFSEEVASTGDVCSAILSMEPGYRLSAAPLSGGVRLAPAWLVSTDTAGYYLDGATGALTRAAG